MQQQRLLPDETQNAPPISAQTGQSERTEPMTAHAPLTPSAHLPAQASHPEAQTVDALLKVLEAEAKRRRQRRFLSRWTLYRFASVIAVMAIAVVVKGLLSGHWSMGDWVMNLWMFALFGGTAAYVTKTHKEAARTLAQFDDVRAVGPLTEALELGDKDIRAEAVLALWRLLPRLQASDASLLNPTQRKILNRVLHKARDGTDRTLAKAILQACEQIGDETALPEVEMLAALPENDHIRDIVQAARACLPALTQRVESVRAAQSLLRASSACAATPETLLRPAAGSPGAAPQELLRSSAPDQTASEPTFPPRQRGDIR